MGELVHGVVDLFHGEATVDDGAENFLLDELEQAPELRGLRRQQQHEPCASTGSQGSYEPPQVSQWVGRDVHARPRQRSAATGERELLRHVQNQVEAISILKSVFPFIGAHVVGAHRLHPLCALLGTDGCDLRSSRFRQLHGIDAKTSGGSDDENPLTSFERLQSLEDIDGSEPHRNDRGRVIKLTKPVNADRLREILGRYQSREEPRSVLVVDDDPDVRAMLGRMLEKTGWDVDEAENGRLALDHLAERRPALILLDLMMPVMDGFDFLVELHAIPDRRDIPVIVLTAKDLTDEDRRVLSGRVEQIVDKEAWPNERVVEVVQKLADDRPAAPSPTA